MGAREGTERADRGRRKSSRQSSQTRTLGNNGACPLSPVHYRCVASNGVSYRKSADWNDRSDVVLSKGEHVQVLEQWIRTPQGWLPVVDKQGAVLMDLGRSQIAADGYPPVEERSSVRFVDNSELEHVSRRAPKDKESRHSNKTNAAPHEAPAAGEPTVEAEFQELFGNLCKRFPNAPPERVAQILRDTGGHAGRAAA